MLFCTESKNGVVFGHLVPLGVENRKPEKETARMGYIFMRTVGDRKREGF